MMQKTTYLLFTVFLCLNSIVLGMESKSAHEYNEQKATYSSMTFHDKLLYLIENDIPNKRTVTGATPLFLASQGGHVDDVKVLLAAGSDVNAKTFAGTTSLHVASQKGHVAIVRQLLFFGANTHDKNYLGYTALELAQQNDHTEIEKFINRALDYELARKNARLAKRKTW